MLSRNYKSIAFATIAAVTLAGCSGGKEEGSQQNFQSPQGRNFVQPPRNNLNTPPAPRNPTSGTSVSDPSNQELLDAINAKGDASIAAANAAKASADAAKAEATAAKDKAAAAETAAKAAESQAQKAKSKANAGFITGIVGAVLAAGGVGLGIWNLNRTKNQGEETRDNNNKNARDLATITVNEGNSTRGTIGVVGNKVDAVAKGTAEVLENQGKQIKRDGDFQKRVDERDTEIVKQLGEVGDATAATNSTINGQVVPGIRQAGAEATRGANAAERSATDAAAGRAAAETGRDLALENAETLKSALLKADEDRQKMIAAQENFNKALDGQKEEAKKNLEAATKAFNDAVAKIEALKTAQPTTAPQILATYVKKDGSILRLDEINGQKKLTEIKIDVQTNSVTLTPLSDAEAVRKALPANDSSAQSFIQKMEEAKLIKVEQQSDVKTPAPAAQASAQKPADDVQAILDSSSWEIVEFDDNRGVATLQQILGENVIGPRMTIELPKSDLRKVGSLEL